MTRRANRKSAAGISLFPFLAVLICTMGSLIMLLVLLMQQARAQAATVRRERTAELTKEQQQQQEKLRMQAEDEQWRAEVLQQQRSEIQAQMAEKRLQLAHLEQHIRKLEDQWTALRAQAFELSQLAGSEAANVNPLEQQKARLEQQLAAAREQLKQTQTELAERPRGYSIVPYPGPNGTMRRPIYIECTARGVILQPENIVLTEEDFAEPLGPGNPLDAALRTIHAHYKRVFANEDSSPYPLIVVRPDGIGSYAAARAAMSGWEDEFGYELVDQNIVLTFPPPDPGLSVQLQEAIQLARQRQELRRQAMPATRGGNGFIVSDRHGGLVRLDGSDASPVGSTSGGRGLGGSGDSSSGSPTFGQQRTGDSATGSANGGDASASSSSNGQTSGGAAGGAAAAGRSSGAASARGAFGGSASSIAATRGEDWALHRKTAGATGYRRPVRVVCRADSLVLVPEAISNDKPLAFVFGDDATNTIDQFVQALHKRVELWGLPPLGGYWRPQLVVQVESDAAQRYVLLEQLLHNSGLELKREVP